MSQYGKPSLSLLGPFDLKVGPDRSPRLPKKAQALMAFLAVGRGRFFSRDQLSTLLWDNSSTEQARQSLRQCLASLRMALGAAHGALLIANNSEVQLSKGDRIAIDTEAFSALVPSLDVGDLERAAGLCRDEFLSGLHVAADPFNRWLALERQRWHVHRLELQHRLALAQAEAGRLDEAVASARLLAELDLLSEQGHRLLIRLLARAGQRAAALKQYERCAAILRDELGVSPDAETTQLAEAIRAGAPAAIAETKRAAPAPANGGEPVAALVLPGKPSIVVLPFANLSGDSGQDYFIEGLVEDITVALGRESWLFVIAGSSALVLGNRPGELREIAAQLGVQYVLKGSVRINGGDVVFVVQLSDALRGAQVWSDRLHDRIDNVFALQERLTARVAAMIAPALKSEEVDRALHRPTKNPTAYDLYLRALPQFRSSRASNEAALGLLQEAVVLDPNYAAAHALAARCFQFQLMFDWRPPDDPGFAEGIRLAHRAIDLGRNDSEALWMAGLALVHLSREIDHGIAQIERSLSLNPNSANAWTASCLARSYIGDSAAAIDHFERAQRLNPLDLSQHLHWNAVAWAYLGSDRIEDAHDAAVRTLNVLPTYPPGLRMKLCTCGLLGRIDEAREYVDRLLRVQPGSTVSWLGKFLRAPLQRNQRAYEMYLKGARLAGLPEG